MLSASQTLQTIFTNNSAVCKYDAFDFTWATFVSEGIFTFLINVLVLERYNLYVVPISSKLASVSQGQAYIVVMAVLNCLQHTLRMPRVIVTWANELWKDNFLCQFLPLSKLQLHISTK